MNSVNHMANNYNLLSKFCDILLELHSSASISVSKGKKHNMILQDNHHEI